MDESKLSSLSKAATDEKIGEFWDTHDFTDFDTDAPDAEAAPANSAGCTPPTADQQPLRKNSPQDKKLLEKLGQSAITVRAFNKSRGTPDSSPKQAIMRIAGSPSPEICC